MATYQIGDKAIDKNGKIFEVESIKEQDFGSGPASFFVMKPCFDYDYNEDYRFYVPVNNANNILHKIMKKEEAIALIDEIPSLEEYPETTPRERKLQYQVLVSTGNRKDICRIIKFLISYREKRKLINKPFSEFDARILKSLIEMLRNEISISLDIPVDEVSAFIESRIGSSYFNEI